MSAVAALPGPRVNPRRGAPNHWVQLLVAVAAMTALASAVVAWPFLRNPGAGLGPSLAGVENAFGAFILAEMLFVPFEGWLGGLRGRWLLITLGAILIVLGVFAGTRVGSFRAVVACYAIGGVGAGLLYGGTAAKLMKEFTGRKVLCITVTAASCSAVVALAVIAATLAVHAPGGIRPLVALGGAQAAVVLLAALYILWPPQPGREPPHG